MLTPEGTVRPDFIIIGAMRSGTTTLDRLLSAHPSIAMAYGKETDYFLAEVHARQRPGWYGEQFDPSFPIHGEASPNYAKADVFPGVPERIAAHCPDVKLVYIVRDPVDRAISQYHHGWAIGRLTGDPEAFVGTHEWRHVLATSRYCEQLRVYLDHFPQERVLVLDFDALIRAPSATMDVLTTFVGAPPHTLVRPESHAGSVQLSRIPPAVLRLARSPLGRTAARVVGRRTRDAIGRAIASGRSTSPPVIPPHVRALMARELAPDAARFRAMTGLPFSGWSV